MTFVLYRNWKIFDTQRRGNQYERKKIGTRTRNAIRIHCRCWWKNQKWCKHNKLHFIWLKYTYDFQWFFRANRFNISVSVAKTLKCLSLITAQFIKDAYQSLKMTMSNNLQKTRIWLTNIALKSNQVHHFLQSKPNSTFIGKKKKKTLKFLCLFFRVNTTCLARSSEDNQWYRALVAAKSSDKKVNVLFIDYGNFETVTLDKIRPLPIDLRFTCITIMCFIDGKKYSFIIHHSFAKYKFMIFQV